jgi:hypothetical protein
VLRERVNAVDECKSLLRERVLAVAEQKAPIRGSLNALATCKQGDPRANERGRGEGSGDP